MGEHNCETCKFRAKFDRNPKSFLGRLWRWHASWCPGWRAYMLACTPEEKTRLADHYKMDKFK